MERGLKEVYEMIGKCRWWKSNKNASFIDLSDMLEFFHVEGSTVND
jgi:hypothetical protein